MFKLARFLNLMNLILLIDLFSKLKQLNLSNFFKVTVLHK